MTIQTPPSKGTVAPDFLLVVDPQAGFITDSSRHVCAALPDLQRHFKTIAYSRYVNFSPSPFRDILGWHKMAPGSADCAFALPPPPDTVIIEHGGYSSLTPQLRFLIQHLGQREICVAGIATEACVLKTVIDLFEAQITPWVLTDLCASDKNTHFHDIALEVIGAMIGQRHLITRDHLALS